MSRFRAIIVQVVLGLLLTSLASAVPAVTFTELVGTGGAGGNLTVGWKFTTNAAYRLLSDSGKLD